jgi:hypothetical protein
MVIMMMAHPQSVLSTSIADYSQEFYDKLAAMEAFTYDESERPKFDELDPNFESGTAGFDEYSPFWSSFNAAILSYFNNTLSRSNMADFLLGIFVHAHATIVRQRGSQQLLDNSDFFLVFGIDGLVEATLNRPIDFYDDYIPAQFALDNGTVEQIAPASAPRLQSDTASISGSAGDPQEGIEPVPSAYEKDEEVWLGLIPQYSANSAANAVRDVYEGVDPSTFGPDLTPLIAHDLVFTQLNWKSAFEVFDVGLPLPVRPSE